jgi:excisionase family DNA binding protein
MRVTCPSDLVPLRSYLSVGQIAREINKSPGFVVREIHAGRLAAIKPGRSYRISRDDFDAYLERCRVRPRQGQASDELRLEIASHRHAAAERRCMQAGL